MKKGFTLVELLVVIVILSLIAMVVYPVIIKVVNDSKESAYETQEQIIIKAAKEWAVEHPNELPSEESITGSVCLTTLLQEGYIDDSIKNPYTSQEMSGYVEIVLTGNKYEYEYKDGICS